MFSKYREKSIIHRAYRAAVSTYSGDMGSKEVGEIRRELDRDSESRDYFEESNRILGALDEWREELSGDTEFMDRAISLKEPGLRPSRRLAIALGGVAATLIAVVTTAIFVGLHSELGDSVTNRYVTAVGDRQEISLPDGSIVTLNTDSEIVVVITDALRRLELKRGEAYFDVASDRLRPFTVELQGQTISVLGTEFNVRRSTDGFTVALIEGTVAVHQQNAQLELPPVPVQFQDEELVEFSALEYRAITEGAVLDFSVEHQHATVRQEKNIQRLQGWRSGKLSFSGDHLAYVIAELNRYSPKKIQLVDSSIGSREIYTAFETKPFAEALKAIEVAGDVKMTPYVDKILVIAR